MNALLSEENAKQFFCLTNGSVSRWSPPPKLSSTTRPSSLTNSSMSSSMTYRYYIFAVIFKENMFKIGVTFPYGSWKIERNLIKKIKSLNKQFRCTCPTTTPRNRTLSSPLRWGIAFILFFQFNELVCSLLRVVKKHSAFFNIKKIQISRNNDIVIKNDQFVEVDFHYGQVSDYVNWSGIRLN